MAVHTKPQTDTKMVDVEEDEITFPELIFKIVVVGNTDVGKSALIRRFIHDSFSAIKSTKPVGAKYKEEILVNLREPFAIDDMLTRLVIWDTENPHDIPPIIEANVNANCTGVLFCYDVCNMQSFQDIEHWMNAVDRATPFAVKALVGLHADRKPEKREVLLSDGRDLATKHGMRFNKTTTIPYPHFNEASSKTGMNVETAVMGLVYRMMKISIELAPRSDKYNVRPAVTPAAGTRPSTQATRASTASSEAQWLAAQTKRPAPPPPRIPTPIVEHWPDSAVARYCRDVGKMSLEEFQWCLDKNHWDAELQHIPFGAPEPPLIDPVWWWPGWGSRWGKLAKPRNPYGYVHNWFVRGKVRAREEFKPYFGTYESEMAREFAASIETIPLVVAVRRDEGTLRSEVAEAAALEPTFVPPEAPPAALSRGASLSRTSLSLHNKK